MKYLGSIVIVVALLLAGAVGLAYSGLPNVAATASESPLLRWLLSTTRQQAVERRAQEVAVQRITDRARIAAGAKAFDDLCAGCHGAPGRDPFVGALDMSPAPPTLSETVPQRSPAELFWVVKHGIRWTGMPAWGPSHSDAELWELVTFIERLPELNGEAYQALLAQGEGHGHDHDHGAHEH